MSAPESACTLEQVRAAKPAAQSAFGKLTPSAAVGVTRVGRGYGLKVNLDREPADRGALPTQINGVPVRVEVVGAVRKREK